MSPVTLYKRQKQILDYISQYIQINGHSPTLQEIADSMDLSSLATVHEHIQALEKFYYQEVQHSIQSLELEFMGILN